MTWKMTRRDLAAALGSAATIAAAHAQEAPPTQPEDPSAAAKEQMRKNAEALAKVDLLESTEPAFQFKA